ncbi:MAG: DUF4234 domain-containing protein [Syntrophobacterales bacterium]|nr:DUF4234 domain-containing protein [Syntrophobacterales bacterium]
MSQENEQISSNFQPVSHLVILSLVTFGFYNIYWFYRTWESIKSYTNADFRPGWRTFGLFIPFYNLFRIDGMFRHDIELLRTTVDGAKLIKKPFLYGLSFVLFTGFLKLPAPFELLYFLSVWPLAGAQSHLNSYWEKGQSELPKRTKLYWGEIALIIIGGGFFLMALIGSFIPE